MINLSVLLKKIEVQQDIVIEFSKKSTKFTDDGLLVFRDCIWTLRLNPIDGYCEVLRYVPLLVKQFALIDFQDVVDLEKLIPCLIKQNCETNGCVDNDDVLEVIESLFNDHGINTDDLEINDELRGGVSFDNTCEEEEENTFTATFDAITTITSNDKPVIKIDWSGEWYNCYEDEDLTLEDYFWNSRSIEDVEFNEAGL